MILKKTLASTPKRLQAMRMRIHRYNTTLVYKPGKSMILADTLSRAYPELSTTSTDQSEIEQVNSLYCLPVTDQRMKEISEETRLDASMQTLIKMIHDGWPVSKDQVPDRPVVGEVAPRAFRIERRDVQQFGPTAGCAGCYAAVNETAQTMHSPR